MTLSHSEVMDYKDLPESSFADKFMDSENQRKGLDGDKSPPRNKKGGIRKMYLAAFTSLLMCFAMGLVTGFSAPATYDMTTRPTSPLKPTRKEVDWIASIIALGVIAGCLISGPLADYVGRKDSLVYNIVPHGFGWLFICYSKSIAPLLIGRFLGGFAVGLIKVVVPIYCVEISTSEVRGILGSAPQGFLVIGNLVSVVVGAYIPWNYLAVHGAVFAIFSVITFLPMPESPRWLLMKNDLKGAIATMDELQGGFVDAKKECQAVYEDLKNRPKGKVTWAELKHPTVLKPGLITLVIMFIQQFSGINAIFLNSSEIFNVSKDFMDPKTATIIIAAVQVVTTVTSNLIVDRAGRKILLILSGILMGVSFLVFGVFYYEISVDATFEAKYNWLPLACTIMAVIGFSLGYGPIPFLLSAEMLPVRVRSVVSAIAHVLSGVFIFIVVNYFSDMVNLMQSYGTFWFYSSVSALGVVFVIFFVPETKGKRLEEIEDLFYKKPKKQVFNIAVIRQ